MCIVLEIFVGYVTSASRVNMSYNSSIVPVRDRWTITVKQEQSGHRYNVSIEQVILS